MISHRCRCKGRGAVLIRFFTSSVVRCSAACVILAIHSLFSFSLSSSLFSHRTRIGIKDKPNKNYIPFSKHILLGQEVLCFVPACPILKVCSFGTPHKT